LSYSVAGDADAKAAEKARGRLDTVRSEMARTQEELSASASAGQQTSLEAELVALAKLQIQITADIAEAGARIAELSARQSAESGSPSDLNFVREELRAQRARLTALEISRVNLTRDIGVKSSVLSGIHARRDQLQTRLRTVQSDLETASKRVAEVESAAGMRAEQLRILDPGIVPQRPSSPNLPLNCAAAFALGVVISLMYLAFTFGLQSQRVRYVRSTFRVAQRGSA
jgi:chromosome segregation ATPase